MTLKVTKRLHKAAAQKAALKFIGSPAAACRECGQSLNQHRTAKHTFNPATQVESWSPEAREIAAVIMTVEAREASKRWSKKKNIYVNPTVAPQELPR